jgi:hypothetical protein
MIDDNPQGFADSVLPAGGDGAVHDNSFPYNARTNTN